MKLKYFDKSGTAQSEKDFGIPEYEGSKGLQALKQVILAYQANQRQGTSSTKTRATVSGTGKKPFRQKGSGTARQGSRVGPQHYHGSVAHGPQPRDWSQRINKKMRQLALSRALFDRSSEGEVAVVEAWEISDKKTKLFAQLLGKIAPEGKLLVVDDSWTDVNLLSVRNLSRIEVTEASDLNAYDLSRFDQIILSESAMAHLLKRISGEN